jgi:solute carrier family 25 oxoglutarate transporter 11
MSGQPAPVLEPAKIPVVVKPPQSGVDKFLDVIQPFLIGGLSGMFATCIVQPVDMIKVQIQLKS